MNRLNYLAVFGVLLIITLIWWALSHSANDNALQVDTQNVENNVQIKHFDDAFFTADTANFLDALAQLKNNYEPFFTSTNDSKFWYDMRTERMQKQLYSDLKRVIPDFETFDENLYNAFSHLYYYYPELPAYEIYTYISRLDIDNPVIIADRLIFIATDLYLGAMHPAYQYQPNYTNYFRQPAFIIPEVMQNIAYQLVPKNQEDNALLNDMIWWGKIYYFKQAMQPNLADSTIASYSQEKMLFCEKNEVEMWSYLIDNRLLFNTDIEPKRRFIEPAPYTKFGMPFDNETPGMIGRWLGWQIIKSYMQANPNVSLQQLMADTDSRAIFRNSKYKP